METQVNCLLIKHIFQLGLHGPVSNTSVGQKPALAPPARTVRATTIASVGDLSHLAVSQTPCMADNIAPMARVREVSYLLPPALGVGT